MRGHYLHNTILINPVHELLSEAGAACSTEYFVGLGFIDLFALIREYRIAIEAELTPDRLNKDIRKAESVSATHLLILVPNSKVSAAVLGKLNRSDLEFSGSIWVLPLGPAVTRLESLISFVPSLNGIGDSNDH